MAKVTGTVEFAGPNKFDNNKFTVKVAGDDRWFNTKQEFMDTIPSKGDVVEFDDGGAKYIQYLKITGKSESAPAPKAGGGGGGFKKAPFKDNTLGIELGHAANNAVQLAIAAGVTDLGQVKELTRDFYDMMKELRSEYEGKEVVPKESKKASPSKKPAPKAEPVVEDDDEELF